MTRRRGLLAGSVIVLLAVVGAAMAIGWTSPIPPVAMPDPATFERGLVAKGEALSRLGNCHSCHTAPQAKPFAGGRKLQTPFGAIFVTNITPDVETGIGGWSQDAFVRAMRQGIARNGEHLYPAFPYDHFTHASESELAALYAFLMTRTPVKATAPANRLRWPLGWRRLVAAWNLLFLHPGFAPDDPAHSAEWNRGRALADGLAHCGGCHTPRNDWGAERGTEAYNGAGNEGWYAPPLNIHSPAVGSWTEDELFTYLRSGFGFNHSAAAGPMSEVTHELARASPEDVRAIAVYFAALMADAAHRGAPPDKPDADTKHPDGATLFAGACAGCHAPGAPMMQQGRPALTLGTSLRVAGPNNTLDVIIHGLPPPAGRSGPAMPAFGEIFSDSQLIEIAAYLRARFTDQPAWIDLAQAVGDVRARGDRQP